MALKQYTSFEIADGRHAPGFLSWVAAMVHEHRGRLIAYARRRGFDTEDCLDAVQDSFVSFLTLPESRGIAHDSEDSLKLLTVILRHNLQNRRKKIGRHRSAQPVIEAQVVSSSDLNGESSEELIVRAEELARVHGCIRRMDKLRRSVVTLSLLDEQPHEEAARLLGISAGYVRVLLHRAREHIRTCSYVYDSLDDDD